ncbi:MAG: aminoacyl-tRNA hydrolase [Bdellovibrionales bacterium]|jgi:peptidyl-tRNA hydrolase, PTH1 family|nr:aminoacyl-tRNA hydrolase [Bdellovibrionales bacterium]MBT3525335.1 aminoacyl-tRNA hydrolase [Bdellovibrionales bacterium]MBT7670640.1 aminoacyl-tRNA hydrolase [Bdellovibrionales bacterium]MBT7765545.1 aminoacyl-tRNA hydrolase [Bdellovibrionales bacterium]
MVKLITFLGNPGPEHVSTRHNIAWMICQRLSFTNQLVWKSKFKGLYASHNANDEKFILLKPQTYMNLSGESVLPCINFFKIDIQDILVVHDELDFEFGRTALKDGGGLAGHNGLRSIATTLGRQDFLRLRLGIGRPQHGSPHSFVLSSFNNDQQIDLDKILDGAAEIVEYFMRHGLARSATKYNKKNFINE